MTTPPHAPGLSPVVARPCRGRIAGNVAVPEMKLMPREAVCRKDLAID
ncbi:hypothetical protein EDD27_9411 [Nonomuraea polychroma]|jgi:hypothetical protein|uniref:Uncharacterized protein n=1 Tax=Nonomuraea polychroma TaxID=46176 RepID=A0A438ML81_9ACTN|nr:hypothetical protein EDD27_9411 [Nonomuraea polychroma]